MSAGVSLAIGITLLAVGTYAMRAAGPVLRKRISVSAAAEKLMDRATVVLLVAVALTGAFFVDHEQWDIFRRERPSTAADEIVRWATPVNCFQRTATQDTELNGTRISEGQRVGLFYGSANYDNTVFRDPFTFDITRNPNPHLGFGGSGAHYCIGANLAKMEIDIMMNAVADIIPDLTKTGEPIRVRSGWLNGIKEMPVRYR